MVENQFDWVGFYKEFAIKLKDYKHNREELIRKVIAMYEHMGMNVPTLEKKGYDISDIDPFTIFGLFNKGIKEETRIKIINEIKYQFNISAEVPKSFDSIPVLNNQNATFYYFIGERSDDDIENLWLLFEFALNYADNQSLENKEMFSKYFDIVRDIKGIADSKLTMGIFWIAPDIYLNLDKRNIWYIYESGRVPKNITEGLPKIKDKLNSTIYFDILEKVKNYIQQPESKVKNFTELSLEAWNYSQEVNEERKANKLDSSKKLDQYDKASETEERSEVQKNKEYSEFNFLEEVYINQDQYQTLVNLLVYKKNIILQGAPGVGKTFMAKRLAYSIMGEEHNERIKLIQFHQSYSYEDFIMGYRPTKDGFELQNGVFYDFCKKAEGDKENDYFFIIDEINRGNLSKIFGELFVLIEKEHRGSYLGLVYSGDKFSVPDNVHIIGMMNTADRSLAMLDYALRRRFSFFEIEPAFHSDGFIKRKERINDKRFDRLIECIQKLNDEIAEDESLGKGFQIGHSYFCIDIEDESMDRQLNNIVYHEIIPLIKEYWFDDMGKVEGWSQRLKEVIQ